MLSTAWRMHISYLTIWVMRHLWASFILRSPSTKLHHGAFSQLFVDEKTSFMYIGSFKCSSVSPLREYNAETVNNRRKLNQSKLPPRLQHVMFRLLILVIIPVRYILVRQGPEQSPAHYG
jgi:hypothetical protein